MINRNRILISLLASMLVLSFAIATISAQCGNTEITTVPVTVPVSPVTVPVQVAVATQAAVGSAPCTAMESSPCGEVAENIVPSTVVVGNSYGSGILGYNGFRGGIYGGPFLRGPGMFGLRGFGPLGLRTFW